MTTVAIHQPQYLPWLPYLAKIEQADVFVWLDDTQYEKNGLQNRNQIRVGDAARWLTVPVRARLGEAILEVRTADDLWLRKHVETLRQSYPAARPQVDDLARNLGAAGDRLLDVALASTRWLMNAFDIQTRCVLASSLGVPGRGAERLLGICAAVGADTYLSGNGARAYQRPSDFAEAGLNLTYQRYEAPRYEQARPGFVADLSALDLALCRPAEARALFTAGLREPEPA
jgi:hypothetical protein